MVPKTDATRAFELNFVLPVDFQVTLKNIKAQRDYLSFSRWSSSITRTARHAQAARNWMKVLRYWSDILKWTIDSGYPTSFCHASTDASRTTSFYILDDCLKGQKTWLRLIAKTEVWLDVTETSGWTESRLMHFQHHWYKRVSWFHTDILIVTHQGDNCIPPSAWRTSQCHTAHKYNTYGRSYAIRSSTIKGQFPSQNSMPPTFHLIFFMTLLESNKVTATTNGALKSVNEFLNEQASFHIHKESVSQFKQNFQNIVIKNDPTFQFPTKMCHDCTKWEIV